jgi:hypothetical protein
MSRSNPQENGSPNPAVRWFEWNGEKGLVRYYDKDAKLNVEVGADFTFMLLDQVGCVNGWEDASDSGIYSNEVKDTRQDVLVVKSFKGGTLAEGLYKDIKDRVNAAGGQFVGNLYIAFKNGEKLSIGSLKFKGAALFAWSEFSKANRGDLYAKAIHIDGFTEGKKGRITYRVPVLKVASLSPETDAAATDLDKLLQTFFESYFNRTKVHQADTTRHDASSQVDQYGPVDAPADSDIPF